MTRPILTILSTVTLTAASLMIPSPPLFAATHNVPASYASIQSGIVAAAAGDTVLVQPGTYTESLNFGGKQIVVRSSDGPLVTTITNSPSFDLVIFSGGETSATVLEGFTLAGGYKAIWCQNAGPTIRHNILRDQNIDNWGAISLGGPTYASLGSSPAIIENNTIVNCTNGAISTFSTIAPIIRNNIIAFNSHYAIHRVSPSQPHPLVEYNDVYANTSTYQHISPGIGSLTLNPLFNANYTLKLASPCIDAGDSAVGFNDVDGTRNDMGAVPHLLLLPIASPISYGAGINPSAIPTLTPTIHWQYFDNPATSQVNYEIQVGSDDDWSVAEFWSTGEVFSSTEFAAYSGSPLADRTVYYIRVRVSDGVEYGEWTESAFFTLVDPMIAITVPIDYPTIQAALDVALSGDTVLVLPGVYQEAINFLGKSVVLESVDGPQTTTILSTVTTSSPGPMRSVDSTTTTTTGLGPFDGGAPLVVDPAVVTLPPGSHGAVVSGFTIDGGNSITGVSCIESDATIELCIIENCFGSNDGGGFFIQHCAATVINNEIKSNRAHNTGGGVFARLGIGYGKVTVSNNSIHDNISGHGTGVGVVQGDGASITRNIIYRNTTENTNGFRGGIYINADSVIAQNNTIDSNFIGITVIAVPQAHVDLRNNIVANSELIGMEIFSSSPLFVTNDYNNVWNPGAIEYDSFTPGTNDISADPLFALDFNLSPASPCISKGDPAVVFNDLDGTRNDIGALPFSRDCGVYVCGDADGDGVVDSGDISFIITMYFGCGIAPEPFCAGDVNCDHRIDMADLTDLISFVLGTQSELCCPISP